jgi:hypothetical protein
MAIALCAKQLKNIGVIEFLGTFCGKFAFSQKTPCGSGCLTLEATSPEALTSTDGALDGFDWIWKAEKTEIMQAGRAKVIGRILFYFVSNVV